MAVMRILAVLVLAAAAADAAGAASALHAQLEQLARSRIFFAHQSVGANIVDGLAALAAREGVPVALDELRIAENGDPLRKLRNFERAMHERGGAVDVALLKFCYVDIGPDTDAAALFEQYRSTLERLQARYPGTVFVHVTVPLTIAQGGIKALAKRLVGRHPYGTVENLRREEYNALLRSAYLGREPFFDLARLESVDEDGEPVVVTWQGRKAPALAKEYTDDGAHLNRTGSLRAARELAAVIASAVKSRAPIQAAAGG